MYSNEIQLIFLAQITCSLIVILSIKKLELKNNMKLQKYILINTNNVSFLSHQLPSHHRHNKWDAPLCIPNT